LKIDGGQVDFSIQFAPGISVELVPILSLAKKAKILKPSTREACICGLIFKQKTSQSLTALNLKIIIILN
jgi:hypothetical protein